MRDGIGRDIRGFGETSKVIQMQKNGFITLGRRASEVQNITAMAVKTARRKHRSGAEIAIQKCLYWFPVLVISRSLLAVGVSVTAWGNDRQHPQRLPMVHGVSDDERV